MSRETIDVSVEDQMRINSFSRLNKRKQELDEEVARLKKELDNIEVAANEIYLPDDIKFVVGDTFVDVEIDEAESILEEKKARNQRILREYTTELELVERKMNELKGQLYARFGKEHINLD